MGAIVYAAIYPAAYKLATEVPQVLRAERPSDAVLVGPRGTLSLRWRVIALCLLLGIVTAVLIDV